MKKSTSIFISLIGIVAVGFAALVYFSPAYQGDPNRYRGDNIANIGTDPFIKQVPADVAAKYKTELQELKAKLKDDPSNSEDWARVGMIKKFFNNYEGARDAWEYGKRVNPQHSIIYFNLGDLYAGYLRDFPKAEENYLYALESGFFTLPSDYSTLADFYSTFYTQKIGEAEKIFLSGIRKFPDEPQLYYRLALYYRDYGDTEAAIRYFKETVKIDPTQRALIEAQLAKLKEN